MLRAAGFDVAAIGLSGLCLVHCLALPIAAALLPILGVIAEAEWLHWLFLCFAFPVSVVALASTPSVMVRTSAGAGLVLLLVGVLGWPTASSETPATVLGGLLLASAHALNVSRHKKWG